MATFAARLAYRRSPSGAGARDVAHVALADVLGPEAWCRLPPAVRRRFGEPPLTVDYLGSFEVVAASAVGRMLAWACRLLGTPVVPREGRDVAAIVRVGPQGAGVAWDREYRWPDGVAHVVHSTKVIDAREGLVERLPARLCMPLRTYEEGGVLHFVSRGYYLDLGCWAGRQWRLSLPRLLSPGVTHVEHRDEAGGWFRFTMTVTHPLFGRLYYQTGRFHAAGDAP